jgi:hypothetical protein
VLDLLFGQDGGEVFHLKVSLRASLDRQVRRTCSAARSIEAITRCTATASSKLGAVRVPSRRSCAETRPSRPGH